MIKSSFGSKMMPHSYFYDKYLQSYDFYCNTEIEAFCWPVAGLKSLLVF